MDRRLVWLVAATGVLAATACSALVETSDLNADNGLPFDTGSDVAEPVDTAMNDDSSEDSSTFETSTDSAAPDSGSMDSGSMDSSLVDSGPVDSGAKLDAGPETPSDCTTFYYGAHSYLICTEHTTWGAADTKCRAQGMRLAKVDSAGEESAILARVGVDEFWLDGTDSAVEGTWIWSYGSEPFAYKAWASGEPNEMCPLGTCDYLIVSKDGWKDYDGSSTVGCVCEQL